MYWFKSQLDTGADPALARNWLAANGIPLSRVPEGAWFVVNDGKIWIELFAVSEQGYKIVSVTQGGFRRTEESFDMVKSPFEVTA